MAEEGLKKTKGARAKRKSSPRTKGIREISAASLALKAKWADPEWRAALIAKRQAWFDAHPGYSRRTNVPDGMRKEEAQQAWAEAKESAKQTMAELEKAGVVTAEDDPKATEALEAAITVMRSPQNQQTKLAAARLVLEYTKSKPASKQHVTVDAAEAWLKEVAAANDERETTEDAKASS
jgi:hypothetical protein